MDDDIDIEEHDLLDNPALKDIFPDLSVIKREIFDNFEGVVKKETFQLEPDAELTGLSTNPSITSENIRIDQSRLRLSSVETKNEIISNERDVMQCSVIIPKPCYNDNVTVCFDKIVKSPFKSNRIILGSRPQVTLLLEDVRPYLLRSKRFCKTCSTLFSDATNLSKHIANLHSNKCLQEDNSEGAYKCKKCNRAYVYEIELRKHISRNHNTYIKSVSSTKKIECVKEKDKISGQGTSQKVNLENQCDICGNKYTQKKNLVRHIKSKHDKNSYLRNRNAIRKDPKKCNVCNITCATDLILKQHIQTHENLVEETVTSTISSNRNESHAVEELDSKEIISKCFHCKKVFRDQKKFIDHLYEILQDQKYSKIEEKHEEDMGEANVNKIDKSRGIQKEYIRCPKCFYYFKYIQVYVAHMIKKHNMKNVPVVKFVSYEDNCFFCGEELATWKQYNKHMHEVHSDQLNKDDRQTINEELQENNRSDLLACKVCYKTYEDPKLLSNHYIMKHTDSLKQNINLNISVFDNSEDYNDSSFFLSILFKCNKCDIHFMFAKCATNHVEHMDMLINWKCPSCLRIFKKKDEILHTKQHMFYDNDFTVYDLCETELSRILFNCPKCAVHFNEESFLCHFQKCGSQIRNSNYCKVCDILIDSDSISSHDESHKSLNDKRNNFIFVETNIKLGKNVKRNDRKVEISNAVGGRLEDSQSETNKIKVFYCHHCKSNLTEFGSKTRCHVEKKCDQIPKYICKHCGLLVTARGQLSHVKFHSNGRTFKLQDALFFDLNGKQIKPPMPDFPKCVGCGMQFIRKQFINSHICTDKNFVICKVCQGKFSDAAFKLHNDFHNYSLGVGSESISSEDLVSHSAVENEILLPEVPKKDLIVKVPKLSLPNVLATDQYFIYICNLCRIAFDFYDRVVEHCQAHFLKETYKYFPTKYCEECDLEFDTQSYERHSQTHSRGEFDKDNTKYLNFDLDFFLQENRIWLKHVYDGFPGKERSRYVAESIYRYEAKVKLSILQAGPFNLTVYKCAKCNCFVDRGSLFKHAKNSCFSQRNHPCRFCGLPFISFNSKVEHEKIHENKDINIKPDCYRIVIFNREEDKIVNEAISERKKYVLYQCRNCDIVVNVQKYADHVCDQKSVSKCKECGLLFQSQDYNLHALKHQECNDYYPRNIKMLLCGQKKQNGEKRTQPPTFRGVVHDYTFYQCSECQACMKDCQSNRHDCDLKYKCDYCELFFVNKQHSKLHTNDPDFVKSNINLIPLKSRPNKHKIDDIEKDDNSSSKSNIESDSSKIDSASKIKQILVYKCPCDLHFFETSLLSTHLSGTSCGTKVKNVGQKCSKCELVFTPKTLFSHVLKHHGNKTVTHKFKIIECCKKENTLYKCCKCALHFPTYGDAYEHCESCKNTNEGKQCTVCERCITSTHIKEHEQLHVTNPTDDDFLIHEVVFNEGEPAVEDETKKSTISECISLSKQHLLKLDLSKYSNVLFKCKDCNFIALDRVTLVCHLLSNTHDVQNLEECTHCQYSFPMASLITHVYVHHNKWKLLRRDLIIQESSVQL